jgi:hypothetical protein
MHDAGLAWLALSEAHSRTGLVPVLMPPDSSDGTGLSGWDFGFIGAPQVPLVDSVSAQDALAYIGLESPVLAPAEEARLPDAALHDAVIAEGPAFLGLVAAKRPADIPAAVGWSGFGADTPWGPDARALKISAVLRSWEDRFGARLLRIGGDTVLRVLVERPPRTLASAARVAAEHFAFANEYTGEACTVRDLAKHLVGNPVWHFWWD